MDSVLVTDFDGTITQNDFFALVAERWMPSAAPDFFEQYRRGEISHVAAMQGFFQYTPTDPQIVEELLDRTEPEADLAATVDRLRSGGWDLIVVSAGSSWYIDKIFDKLGIKATVYSNPGSLIEGRGLQLDDLSRDVDKAGIVRESQERYRRVAFAGDGPPDVAPALLVSPDLRFARRYLAEELTRRSESFRPFDRWSAIVDELLKTWNGPNERRPYS